LQEGVTLLYFGIKVNTNRSQALVLAHETSRYTPILQSTKAIVFFGTPHSGSAQAEFLSVLADVVAAAGTLTLVDRTLGKLRQDLIRILKPRSTELEDLSMSFTERSKDIEIVSFYEENTMPPFRSQVSCVSIFRPAALERCS
jgi:ankyrin repeat domain-containing protein 50